MMLQAMLRRPKHIVMSAGNRMHQADIFSDNAAPLSTTTERERHSDRQMETETGRQAGRQAGRQEQRWAKLAAHLR